MSSRFWTMHQLTAPFRGRRHDTPVSDQVSDNGTEHSGISVPGPGRLATGKIIKRRPSEVLRDKRSQVQILSPRPVFSLILQGFSQII
jgi:hypothetical protein